MWGWLYYHTHILHPSENKPRVNMTSPQTQGTPGCSSSKGDFSSLIRCGTGRCGCLLGGASGSHSDMPPIHLCHTRLPPYTQSTSIEGLAQCFLPICHPVKPCRCINSLVVYIIQTSGTVVNDSICLKSKILNKNLY